MTDHPNSPPIPKPSKEAKRRAVYGELRILLAALIVLALLTLPTVVILKQHTNSGVLGGIQQGTTNTQEVLNFIKDCTTPSGKCYKQSQANTTATLGKVELIVVLAAVCAKQSPTITVPQVQACVEKGLGH